MRRGVALLVLLMAAPSAYADRSATLTITGPQTVLRGSRPDPFTIQGSVGGADQYGDNAYYVTVGLRPAALGPCGANPIDYGDNPTQSPDYIYGPEKDYTGPADFSFPWHPAIDGSEPAGPFLLCGWVAGRNTDTQSQMTVNVVRPQYRVKISGPSRTRVGRHDRFSAQGYAQSAGTLVTQILPPSVTICSDATGLCHQRPIHRCEKTAKAEDAYTQDSDEVGWITPDAAGAKVNGSFSFHRTMHATRPGTYRYCTWLLEDDSDEGDVPDPASAFAKRTFRVDR